MTDFRKVMAQRYGGTEQPVNSGNAQSTVSTVDFREEMRQKYGGTTGQSSKAAANLELILPQLSTTNTQAAAGLAAGEQDVSKLQDEYRALKEKLKLAEMSQISLTGADRAEADEYKAKVQQQYDEATERLRAIDPNLVDPTLRERIGKVFKGTGQTAGGNYLSTLATLGMSNEDAYTMIANPFEDQTAMLEDIREDYTKMAQRADELSAKGAESLARAKQGAGAVGEFAVDLGSAGLLMGADALLGLVNPALATASMGARSFGGAAQEARAEGASESDQFAYATTTAAKDILLNKFLGGLGRVYGNSKVGKAVTNMVDSRVTNPQTRRMLTAALNAALEGGEEALESVAGNALKSIYNDKGALENVTDAELGDYLYEALIGAALGGATELIGSSISRGANPADTAAVEQTTEPPAATTPATPVVEPAPVSTQLSPSAHVDTVLSILRGDVSNRKAESIFNNPDLKATFEALGLGELNGTNSQNRATVKQASQALKNGAENAGDINTPPLTTEAPINVPDALNSNGTTSATRAEPTPFEIVMGLTPENKKSASGEAEGSKADSAEIVRKLAENVPAMQGDADGNMIYKLKNAPANIKTGVTTESGVTGVAGANYEAIASDGSITQVGGKGNVEFSGDMVRTQTNSSDPLYSYSERTIEGLRPEDSVHLRHSDQSVDAAASRRYNADKAGEKADLFESGEAWTDADTVLAHKFLSEAVDEARKTGNYVEVVRLQREWERQGTAEGQAMRQRRRFVNTPESIIAEAANFIYGDEGKVRKLRPKEKAGIMETVSDYAQDFNKIAPGDTAQVVDMIKRVSATRRTTGLFSSKTSRQMEWALKQAESFADGYSFLRDVLATQIRSIASDYSAPSRINQAKQIRFTNMLSKLSTFARNLVANNILDPMEAFANNQAVPLDIFLSKFTGTRSVAVDRSWFSEAKRKGTGEGFIKSFIQVGLDADISDVNTKYEQSKGRTFKMTGNLAERFMSTWEKYESYALKTTDEAQKGGIRAETQRGINDLKERGLVAEDALQTRAEDVALDRTLQAQGTVAKTLSGLRNAANNIVLAEDEQGGQLGLGEVVMPFAAVPANATVKAVQYTPAGTLETIKELAKTIKAARKGTLTADQQARFVTSFGRTVTGVELVAISTGLALAGLIRVSNSDDKDEREMEKEQGLSGTQFNVSATLRWINGEGTSWQNGDILVDIGFAEQLNAALAMGVMIADAYTDNGEVKLTDVARANGEAVIEAVSELPALSTFANIANAYRYSNAETAAGKALDAGLDFAANTATSFVVPNALRGVAAGMDNTVRDTYTKDTTIGQAWDYLKSGVPLLRKTLPESLNVWGQPRKYEAGPIGNLLNQNILPGSVTRYQTDAVTDEINRLYQAGKDIDDFPNVLPQKGSRTMDLGNGETMTPEEYEQYSIARGEQSLKLVQDFIDSKQYEELTDEQRAEVISNLYSFAADRAKKEIQQAHGIKYKGDWDDEAKLHDLPEYLAAKSRFDTATADIENRDYKALDDLVADWNGLRPGTQRQLERTTSVLDDLIAARKAGVNSETWYTAKDAVSDYEKSNNGKITGVAALRVLLGEDFTPREEAYLVSDMTNSKEVERAYEAFTSAGYPGFDALSYLLNGGSNKDGTMNKKEEKKYVKSNYGSRFEEIWAILYPNG